MTINNPIHPAHSNVPRLYNSAEVAEILNITPRQVARLRQSGDLKCVRISGAAARHTLAQIQLLITERSNDEAGA